MQQAYIRNSKKSASVQKRSLWQSGNERRDAAMRIFKRLGKNKKRLLFSAIIVFCLLSIALINSSITLPMTELAKDNAYTTAARLMNASISETLEAYTNENTGFFTKQTLTDDGSTALFIDALSIASLKSRIVDDAQKRFDEVSKCSSSIAIGSICPLALLNGRGPEINFVIEPVGSITGCVNAAFTSAGVNQTLYTAELELTAELRVVMLGRVSSVTVVCDAPICETIIAGGVPHAYTNVSSMDDALNLIPTDAD